MSDSVPATGSVIDHQPGNGVDEEDAASDRSTRAKAPGPGFGFRAWWLALVPVVVVLVGAWIYRWVDEDAFINFRIIDNLVAGHGLVYNLGERVEADSDPLWLFSLTGLHGILPFMSLEWLSVVLGLICTGVGFLAGGRGVQRLIGSRDEDTVFPLGMLMVAVVAGVWEFATSGLEMSMVFLWLGLCFLLLVRAEGSRRRGAPAAVVMGLGVLIRPELALESVVFVAALLVVVTAPGWSEAHRRLSRGAGVVAAALALPVAFELFRMGYYALVVPNTGLAKAGGSSWWSQGVTYLWNLLAPYALWLPLLLAVPLVLLRARQWWGRGDRIGVMVMATPIAAGLVDVFYVVRVGGDYMHARLLLPGLFSICLPVAVSLRQARTVLAVPLVGIVVWCVVSAGWLRFVPPKTTSLSPQAVFISNERNSWITATGNAHPITAGDYRHALSGQAGALLVRLAHRVPTGKQRVLVIVDPFAPISSSGTEAGRSPLPFTLAVNVPAIGVIGYLAGPDVYLFDSFSLANPIGSHTVVVRHARPGHEKEIGPAWMVARFGIPGPEVPTRVAASSGNSGSATDLSRTSVDAARAALGCAPLSSYLHAITAPLTASQALANIGNAIGFTTMHFGANPNRAVTQLCGPSSRGTR